MSDASNTRLVEYACTTTDCCFLHGSIWHPKDALVIAYGSNGRVSVHGLRNGEFERRGEIQSGKAGLRDACFLDDDNVCLANEEGHLLSIDLKRGSCEGSRVDRAHTAAALAVSSVRDSLVVSGGEDGDIHLWDVRNRSIRECTTVFKDGKSACWCLDVTRGHELIAGFADGLIRSFDLRRLRDENNPQVWQLELSHGICGISRTSKDVFLASTLCNELWCGPVNEPSLIDCKSTRIGRGECTLWTCTPCPRDSSIFVVGDGNGSVHVCTNGKKVANIETETMVSTSICCQPVVSAEWHQEQPGVILCASMDQRIRVLLCMDEDGSGM